MASDGRAHYAPLAVNDEKGQLESIGMVLPPLTVQTDTSSRSWHRRKTVLSAIVVTVVVVVIIAATASVVSLTKNREPTEEFTEIPSRKEPEKQIKPETNFRMDLRRTYEKIMEEKKPEDLKNDFDYYKTELTDVRNPSDLRDFLAVLRIKRSEYDLNEEDVRYAINLTEELCNWYEYLNEMRRNFTQYDAAKGLWNGTATPSVAIMNGRKKKELNDLMMEWRKPMSTDSNGLRTVFKRNVILISEIVQLLKTNPKLLKRDIYVFASDVIYLDEDVSLPETNIALISPLWSFTKGINIFTSGLNAAKHDYDTAISGNHGLPGRRGGNGGYFFGVGNMSVNELRVETDGGRGSDGQHGSTGRDGSVSRPEGYTSSEPFSCRKPMNHIKNKFGDFITYYEVYRDYGCGGNGMDGGAAGPGGEGGLVMLVDLKDGNVRINSGRKGASGSPGRGGAPGSGASWGCRFYAEGTERGNLQQVTKEVCGFFMPDGAPGRDGWNTGGMEEPVRRNSSFFADVLRDFRSYAMEEYAIGRKGVWQLAEKLDELGIYDNRTIVQDFIDEMIAAEKIGKIEFYDSLNGRMEKALGGPMNRQLLTHLRTLSCGKELALKNEIDNYVIVDLDLFLEKVSDDLKSTDKNKLTFKDHTTPIFLQLLKGKMNYLRDALDQWRYKTSKLIAEYDLSLSRKPANLPQQIDGRNMAYLTSLAAGVVKSLSSTVLVYPGEEKSNNVTSGEITVNDLMIHSESKSSTGRFSRHQSRMMAELKAISRSGSNWKPSLKKLKQAMDVLNNLIDPQSEVSDFPILLDYFESTAGLLETVREKLKFSESIAQINSMKVVSNEVKRIRECLFDTLITTQYKNALSVFRQWVFPHMYAYDRLVPNDKNLTLEDAQIGISILRKSVKEYKSTITSYDKFIREAVFSGNNSVGEYYKWYNDDIRSDLIELFRGRAISLTADVENFHMSSKNAIKFRTVKLEFQSRRSEPDELQRLLTNVQVELKHSGYSYYYYNGRSYLQTGEGFDLRYSFESLPNGLPVNFNMVYKKLMDGPPIFSPYTTWTVRLNQVPDELINFVDDVDIALIGLGSYIEVVDNV